MAWFRAARLGKILLAGAACGASGLLLADDVQVEIPSQPEATVLQPDEDLGPIYRLPESSANQAESAPDWKPNWRQPTPARPVAQQRAAVHDPLAPPEIDLPVGTDAPPVEPEAPKQSSRRNRGSVRTANASPAPMQAQNYSPPTDRRTSRPKSTAPSPQLKSPVDVEIPGVTDLQDSPTLPEGTLPNDQKENTPARRGFMSRIFRPTPPSPAEAQRPTRTGWGGLFRGGPVSR